MRRSGGDLAPHGHFVVKQLLHSGDGRSKSEKCESAVTSAGSAEFAPRKKGSRAPAR